MYTPIFIHSLKCQPVSGFRALFLNRKNGYLDSVEKKKCVGTNIE